MESVKNNAKFIRRAETEDDVVDLRLLEILACPVCKGKLQFDKAGNELICRFDQLAYPIEEEIPVLIVERARCIKE